MVVLSVLFAVGGLVYFNVAWINAVPTSWLLALKTDGHTPASDELISRLAAGVLTPSQVQQLLKDALEPSRGAFIDVRSPCPIDIQLPVKIGIGHMLKPFLADSSTIVRASVENWTLEFDGRVIASADGYHPTFNNGIWTRIRANTPRLAPGTHDITFEGDIVIQIASAAATCCVDHVEATTQLTVVNRPVTDFVKPVWSPCLADRVASRMSLYLRHTGDGEKGYGELTADCPPLPVCGKLSCREYNSASPFITHDCDSASFPADFCNTHRCGHLLLKPAGRYTVRLEPDPVRAFCDDFSEYFDGVIEWQNIGLFDILRGADYGRDGLPARAIYPPDMDFTRLMEAPTSIGSIRDE